MSNHTEMVLSLPMTGEQSDVLQLEDCLHQAEAFRRNSEVRKVSVFFHMKDTYHKSASLFFVLVIIATGPSIYI
jgi:hypothetical protein